MRRKAPFTLPLKLERFPLPLPVAVGLEKVANSAELASFPLLWFKAAIFMAPLMVDSPSMRGVVDCPLSLLCLRKPPKRDVDGSGALKFIARTELWAVVWWCPKSELQPQYVCQAL